MLQLLLHLHVLIKVRLFICLHASHFIIVSRIKIVVVIHLLLNHLVLNLIHGHVILILILQIVLLVELRYSLGCSEWLHVLQLWLHLLLVLLLVVGLLSSIMSTFDSFLLFSLKIVIDFVSQSVQNTLNSFWDHFDCVFDIFGRQVHADFLHDFLVHGVPVGSLLLDRVGIGVVVEIDDIGDEMLEHLSDEHCMVD